MYHRNKEHNMLTFAIALWLTFALLVPIGVLRWSKLGGL